MDVFAACHGAGSGRGAAAAPVSVMIANSAALTNGCTAGVLRKTINMAMPSATPQAASKSKARRQSSPM